MTTLFDHLAALDVVDVHCLMPSMGIACGIDTLALVREGGRYLIGTTSHRDPAATITCPDCLTAYGSLEGLRAEITAQQRRQG